MGTLSLKKTSNVFWPRKKKITLIFNLRVKNFPASFKPYCRELLSLSWPCADAGATEAPPPLCRVREAQVALSSCFQQVKLTRHIKTHLLNAGFDCFRLGQSQVKIVQPIVFQSLQTACQVLFGHLVQEADNRGWKKNWQFQPELQRAVIKCNPRFKSPQRKPFV